MTSFIVPKNIMDPIYKKKKDKTLLYDSKFTLILNSFYLALFSIGNLLSFFDKENSKIDREDLNSETLNRIKSLLLFQFTTFLMIIILKIIFLAKFAHLIKIKKFLKIYNMIYYFIIFLILTITIETRLEYYLKDNKYESLEGLNLHFFYILLSYISYANGKKRKFIFFTLMMIYFQTRKIMNINFLNIYSYFQDWLVSILIVIFYFRYESLITKRFYFCNKNKQSSKLYKEIIDSVNEGVVIINKNYEYLFYNEFFKNEFGNPSVQLNKSEAFINFKTKIYNDEEQKNSPHFHPNLLSIMKDSISKKSDNNILNSLHDFNSNGSLMVKIDSYYNKSHEIVLNKCPLDKINENNSNQINDSKSPRKKEKTFSEIISHFFEKINSENKKESAISSPSVRLKSVSKKKSCLKFKSRLSNNSATSTNKKRLESINCLITPLKKKQCKNYFFIDDKTKEKYSVMLHPIFFLKELVILMSIRPFQAETEREYLKQVNNFQSKLLGSISHELKTPINGAVSIMECLRNEEVIKKAIKLDQELILPALNCLKSFSYTINDILDYSKFNSKTFKLNLEEIDLPHLIEDTVKLVMHHTIKRGIKFTKIIDENAPHNIISDPIRIRQVVLNLLSNAIKYQKGEIDVSIHSVKESHKNSLIKIEISDNGIGISPTNLKKLFVLQPTPAGMIGFGLTISNMIAKQLNRGRTGIEVSSKEHFGTKFTFFVSDFNFKNEFGGITLSKTKSFSDLDITNIEFGINDEARSKTVNEFLTNRNSNDYYKFIQNIEKRLPQINSSELKIYYKAASEFQNKDFLNLKNSIEKRQCYCPDILLVDDSSFNILTMKLILEKIGLIVDDVTNGNAAILKVENKYRNECCNKYKIIFMDINMEPMDGFATSKALFKIFKEKNFESPVIAWTANDGDIKLKCIKAGMKQFIEKPIEIKKLNKFLVLNLNPIDFTRNYIKNE